jgi:predicted ribosome quality control (RQC) complex YloA/Tae2 family protein
MLSARSSKRRAGRSSAGNRLRQLYTLELIALVRELQGLRDFHVDKFYESAENVFRLGLSKGGERADVRCVLPYSIGRTEYIEHADEPTNFAAAVRKRISGFVISAVEQYNNDRIILIGLKKGTESANMILEMFGQGNLIITDQSMRITLAYKPHTFKDRDVRPGMQYLSPKGNNTDLTDAKIVAEEMGRICGKDDAMLPQIARMGLGTLYAEEALTRAGVSPKALANSLDERASVRVSESVNKIIKECVESRKARVYKKGDEVVNFAICDISKYAQSERVEYDSVQKALDQAYRMSLQHVAVNSAEVEGLKQSMEKQSALIKGLDDQIADSRKAADIIMGNMQIINNVIDELRKNKRMTKDELQKLAKDIKILDVNLKDKTVTIELKA